jgi:hypothetical protein
MDYFEVEAFSASAIKAGLYELAAVEAGKSPVTCEIFTMAADAAGKEEGKWRS